MGIGVAAATDGRDGGDAAGAGVGDVGAGVDAAALDATGAGTGALTGGATTEDGLPDTAAILGNPSGELLLAATSDDGTSADLYKLRTSREAMDVGAGNGAGDAGGEVEGEGGGGAAFDVGVDALSALLTDSSEVSGCAAATGADAGDREGASEDVMVIIFCAGAGCCFTVVESTDGAATTVGSDATMGATGVSTPLGAAGITGTVVGVEGEGVAAEAVTEGGVGSRSGATTGGRIIAVGGDTGTAATCVGVYPTRDTT